jgi:glutamate dehydrogenase
MVATLQPGLDQLTASLSDLLREEARGQGEMQRARLRELGAPDGIANRIVQLFELNGGIGISALAQKLGVDPIPLTRAYTKLGEALGLDWAQAAANRFEARDQWERLLTAGLARDFEQLRLEFLERRKAADPKGAVDQWVQRQGARIDQFRRTVDRARTAPVTTAPMLAQIATQARVLLAR